jgi:hypothetical protein
MRFLLLLSLFLAAPAFAQLKWDNLEQTLKAKPGDREVVATYRFVNNGTAPVKITSVHTSCGCTTAALAKEVYAPGESGVITARMDVGSRTGHQEKSILVTTSDSPKTPTMLRLLVDIPEAVIIKPSFVVWSMGESPEPKTIDIKIGDGFPAKLLRVDSDNPDIKIEVHEVQPGRELEVKVTPPNTKRPESATLLVRTDYPTENPQTYYAYVRVK